METAACQPPLLVLRYFDAVQDSTPFSGRHAQTGNKPSGVNKNNGHTPDVHLFNPTLRERYEKEALGLVIVDPERWTELAAVNIADFRHGWHRSILNAMHEVVKRGEPLEYISVATHLARVGIVDEGLVAYLTDLTNGLSRTSSLKFRLDRIRKAAREERDRYRGELLLNPNLTREEREKIAQEMLADQLAGNTPGGTSAAGRRVVLKRAKDIKPERIEYLWPRYLPRNKMVGAYGNSTEGKSPVTTDIAARVTRGADWPDGTKNMLGPRSVLILSSEDDPADTILPRFLQAGGDPDKLYIIEGSCPAAEEGDIDADTLALDRDIQALKTAAQEIPDLALIILDPTTNHLGEAKYTNEQETRRVLMPLKKLTEELNICTMLVGHFNKNENGVTAQNRVMGAKCFYGLPRFVYLFGPDNNSENRFAHIMVQSRGCGAPAWKYHTEAMTLLHEDKEFPEVIQVVWDGQCDANGDDAVNPVSQDTKSAEAEAGKALRAFLAAGKRTVEDCKAHLKAQSYCLDENVKGSLNPRRVRNNAKAEHHQEGKVHYWQLRANEVATEGYLS